VCLGLVQAKFKGVYMNSEVVIPKDVEEIMSYLSQSFSKSMHSSVHSKEDLYNDLVILYLENLNSGKVKNPQDKNHWFIFFKSRLLNKYKEVVREKRGLNNYIKESQI